MRKIQKVVPVHALPWRKGGAGGERVGVHRGQLRIGEKDLIVLAYASGGDGEDAVCQLELGQHILKNERVLALVAAA